MNESDNCINLNNIKEIYDFILISKKITNKYITH